METKKHPLSELMDSSMQNLRSLVNADTVIGEPITTPDGVTIIPVSKVSFGFGSGGSDIAGKEALPKDLFGGGAGGGVSVKPMAFLVIKKGEVEVVQIYESKSSTDRVIGLMPELIDKLSALFKKDSTAKTAAEPAAEDAAEELN